MQLTDPDPHVHRHLRHVVRTLRATVPDPSRAAPRAALLDLLEAYAERGRYPSWEQPIASRPRRVVPDRRFDAPGRRSPRFRDAKGTWCAVGHLISATDPALAEEIAARFEPAWLDDMEDARLGAWAAAHGFTTDELAWIQPSYCYQPPVCDEVEVQEPAAVLGASCVGADPRFQEGTQFCQACDGPFRVWAAVENPGDEAAEVSVELWGSYDEVFDRVDGITVAPGEAVSVELTTARVEDVGAWGGIRLIASADCETVGSELQIWEAGNGGPGWVLPDECGGSCDTGGSFRGDGLAGRGCSSSPTAAPWGLVFGLGLLVRRSTRRPSA